MPVGRDLIDAPPAGDRIAGFEDNRPFVRPYTADVRVKPQLLHPLLLVSGLLAVLMGVAGSAWACLPQANLVVVRPQSSGPAGSTVTIEAIDLDPGRSEVRWNTAEGELLGASNGPNFSMGVTIPPKAGEGLYSIIVLSRAPDGALGNTRTTSFLVTDPTRNRGTGRAQSQGAVDARPTKSSDGSTLLMVGVAMAVVGAGGGLLLGRRRKRA